MKKVLSVLLTGAMAVSMLAGCGGGSSAPAQSEAPAEQGKEEAPAEQGGAEAPAEPPTGGKRGGRKKDKSVPSWKPERFEAFWEYYRTHARGEDRQGAVQEWDKLQPDDALIDTMARALQAQVRSESWRDGVGIPYAKRWLKHARWTDTPKAARDPDKPDGPAREPGVKYI